MWNSCHEFVNKFPVSILGSSLLSVTSQEEQKLSLSRQASDTQRHEFCRRMLGDPADPGSGGGDYPGDVVGDAVPGDCGGDGGAGGDEGGGEGDGLEEEEEENMEISTSRGLLKR